MRFTVKEFFERYPDDDACLDEIMAARMPDLLACPGCGVASPKFHRLSQRRAYSCQDCGHHYYPCADTLFKDSRTPLRSWFYAIYLFTQSRHGVPAKELERALGVTYKCAWRMAREIRKLMTSDRPTKLWGHIEMDETLVGGANVARRKGRKFKKTMLVGMLERDGRVVVVKARNARKVTLRRIVAKNIVQGSTVSTDEHKGYILLPADGYEHGTVNHRAAQYVDGKHGTQAIESFWARLKLSIRGTHVFVSPKYLQFYAGEFAWRHSNREAAPAEMFDRLIGKI